ncbi:TolC family protein [Flavihumibacter profundi]|uniref:TolC family protein n=1 Tax=Flavihumibacter profundi TaxID=2716883 RepID=UPI001CC3FCB6|nr:TolC family protein [Flavihumibacter profundi]MBZ5857326.1 TolC family protein [Flavihumibacter profundi]
MSLSLLKRYLAICLALSLPAFQANSQVVTLKNALATALENYGSIKAKAGYLKASKALEKESALERLPDFGVAAQNSYGTVNGQFGPSYPSKISSTSSAGPIFLEQNWNAAFGSLYLANINWDIFSFGRVRQNIKVARARVLRDTLDLEQEKFQHQVRVSAAYLNLLAAQRLRISQQKNLDRANALGAVVIARTKNGLNAGVDSSQANAEISNAKTALTNAIDFEMEQRGQLAQLMGVPYQDFFLDSLFLNRIPASLFDSAAPTKDHPLLKYYQSRIDVSKQQEKFIDRSKLPVVSVFGVMQTRGSGFGDTYSLVHPEDYTHNYWEGIKPDRSNYLLGMGIAWNLTSILRVNQQVAAQQWTSKGLEGEYEVVSQQIKTQQALAVEKIKNALANYQEAPVQTKAASDAYLQKSVLYTNGLTNIVDITQALYTLNRAEIGRDIANINVWQALLLKAAASGDFSLFINEFK